MQVNKKCFLVKVSVNEDVFREVENRLWKPKNSPGLLHYKSSREYGKGEGEYGEEINYSFTKEGSLIKSGESNRLIVDKQLYGESLEDVESEVNKLVDSDRKKSLSAFLKKWKKGREKEDLINIYDRSINDYDIKIEELNYIVLESSSLFEFTKLVNEHLKLGWKVLGGMQLSTAGGGESVYRWKERYYLQSLTNSQS